MTIHCEIISQDRMVFKGEADIVTLPGASGDMGILPNHSSLLTILRYGIITVRLKGNEQYFTVAGGFAEVQPEQVTILADVAENVIEIDINRAEEAKKRVEARLKEGKIRDVDEFTALKAALTRSNIRIDAVYRYRLNQGINKLNDYKNDQE